MIIKITNLSVGIHAFRFEKSVDELQLGEPFVDNLILDCKLDKSHHQIVINCNLTISADLSCDRCNVDFLTDYTSNFILLFLFNAKDFDNAKENVKFLSASEDKIDLLEDVLDYARLLLPMKKLCKEECEGLCVKCGANLNQNKCSCSAQAVESVWEPLSKLKDKLN